MLANVPPGSYTVTITGARGCTAVATYEVSFTIGTASPGETIGFPLFPNPAEHTVWLELGGSGSYFLEMYEASGRRVLLRNVATGRQQVVLGGLFSGTYLAVVKNGNGEAVGSGRLVVK